MVESRRMRDILYDLNYASARTVDETIRFEKTAPTAYQWAVEERRLLAELWDELQDGTLVDWPMLP